MQAQVERVQDAAHNRDAEIRLEVLVMVPAQRGHGISGLDPQPPERESEFLRPLRHVAIRVAVKAPVRQARHDFLLEEMLLRTPKHPIQRQLIIHHQAVHAHSSFCTANRVILAQSVPRSGRNSIKLTGNRPLFKRLEPGSGTTWKGATLPSPIPGRRSDRLPGPDRGARCYPRAR